MSKEAEKTGFEPLYEKVKLALRSDIESGKLPVGTMLPSTKDLAAQFSVSIITVRRALEDLTRENLLERVVGVGTFVNATQPPLRVALVLLGAEDIELWRPRSKLFGDLMAGIGEIAWQSWGGFSVSRVADSKALDRFLADETSLRPLNGILVKPHLELTDDDISVLAKWKVPFVLIKRNYGEKLLNYVTGDDFGEARQLTEHLLERGYHRIGFIGPPSDDVFDLRYGGYVAAHEAMGLAVDESLAIQARDYDVRHGADWTTQLLRIRPLPEAIFCGMGTYVARQVLEAILARGLSIPQDIGFVMHDPDDSGELFEPPVTSAGCSSTVLGRKAAELLNRAMLIPDDKPSGIVLPPHLSIRDSTRFLNKN